MKNDTGNLTMFADRVAAILDVEYNSASVRDRKGIEISTMESTIDSQILRMSDTDRAQVWALGDNLAFWTLVDRLQWGILVVKVAFLVADDLEMDHDSEIYECLVARMETYRSRLTRQENAPKKKKKGATI